MSSLVLLQRSPAHSEDLQELLSHVAPFAGYDSAKSYFEHENPVRA